MFSLCWEPTTGGGVLHVDWPVWMELELLERDYLAKLIDEQREKEAAMLRGARGTSGLGVDSG